MPKCICSARCITGAAVRLTLAVQVSAICCWRPALSACSASTEIICFKRTFQALLQAIAHDADGRLRGRSTPHHISRIQPSVARDSGLRDMSAGAPLRLCSRRLRMMLVGGIMAKVVHIRQQEQPAVAVVVLLGQAHRHLRSMPGISAVLQSQ